MGAKVHGMESNRCKRPATERNKAFYCDSFMRKAQPTRFDSFKKSTLSVKYKSLLSARQRWSLDYARKASIRWQEVCHPSTPL